MRTLRFLLVMPMLLTAVDFHVAPDGDDAADGLTPATAWRTAERAAHHLDEVGLQPGDRLCFAGGATFALQRPLLVDGVRSHGEAQQPITITSYGDGRATLTAQASTAIAVFLGTDAQALHLTIANLDFAGDGSPMDGNRPAQGIQLWNNARAALAGFTVHDVTVHGFAGDGINVCRELASPRITEVTIRRVISRDNPGCAGHAPHSGSGIVIGGVTGAAIEDCVALRNGERNDNPGGPVGIWYWDAIDSAIRRCRAEDNRTIHGDGGGFDLDGGCQGCVIEHCLSRGNAGAGYLLAQFSGAHRFGPLRGNIIRGNLSIDDGRQGGYGGIHLWAAGGPDIVGDNLIQHNTIVMTGVVRSGKPAGIVIQDRHVRGVRFVANRILVGDGHALVRSTHALGADTLHFTGNVVGALPGGLQLQIPDTATTVQDWFVAHDAAGLWQDAHAALPNGAAALDRSAWRVHSVVLPQPVAGAVAGLDVLGGILAAPAVTAGALASD